MRRARAGWPITLAMLLAAGCAGAPPDQSGTAGRPANGTPSDSAAAGTATPATPASPTATPAPRPPHRISIAMSGDVLLHSGLWETAAANAADRGRAGYDFDPVLADMRPFIRAADLAICHLETPLASPGGPFESYPVFNVPPQVVPALVRVGYDACTTASNHSLDQGLDGVLRTLDRLEEAGVAHAGTAASRRDARSPTILDVDGVSVALLSYTYGTNGFPIPAEAPWSVPLIDVPAMLAKAHQARAEGADIVLVALHAGTEYQTSPNEQQLAVFDALSRSDDIDLVYGHHAHVPQPFDRLHGTWVVYGLGNFVAQQLTSIPDTYRGVTARFTFVEQPDGSYEARRPRFVPTLITAYDPADPDMRVLNAPAALLDPDTDPALRPALREAVTTVRADVFSLGARAKGLRMVGARS